MTEPLAAPPPHRIRLRRPSIWVRRARLLSGSMLFVYLICHFINHSLGLVSVSVMGMTARELHNFWRGPLGTALLYPAFITHLTLAFWALYERRYFRVRWAEMVQLLLGFSIPMLLFGHLIATRVAFSFYDVTLGYRQILLLLWVDEPEKALLQALLLLVAWTHGCMGLNFWLRLKPIYPRILPFLLTFAVLLPVTALLGFATAGREVARYAADPQWVTDTLAASNLTSQAVLNQLVAIETWSWRVFFGLIVLVLIARGLRLLVERRRGTVRVTYPDQRVVRIPQGLSLLDASRSGKIPHASVCGGRGRCSTCRVRVLHGLAEQPPASSREHAVLERVGAEPDTRLACQLYPVQDLTIVPLLPETSTAADGQPLNSRRAGHEQPVVILFTDMRGSTPLAEQRLPYDVVFILNRFFEVVGSAVLENGGLPNQFIGDSVMALFGMEDGIENGSRQALAAAEAIGHKLDALNRLLADDLPTPLRIGIGIHAGVAIVGEMGYRETSTITAVGDPVHVAARLQELTKTYKNQLIISEVVGDHAGISLARFERHEIQVRGRQEPLAIRIVPDARDLALETMSHA